MPFQSRPGCRGRRDRKSWRSRPRSGGSFSPDRDVEAVATKGASAWPPVWNLFQSRPGCRGRRDSVLFSADPAGPASFSPDRDVEAVATAPVLAWLQRLADKAVCEHDTKTLLEQRFPGVLNRVYTTFSRFARACEGR